VLAVGKSPRVQQVYHAQVGVAVDVADGDERVPSQVYFLVNVLFYLDEPHKHVLKSEPDPVQSGKVVVRWHLRAPQAGKVFVERRQTHEHEFLGWLLALEKYEGSSLVFMLVLLQL